MIRGLETDHCSVVYSLYKEELGAKAEEVDMIC